MANIDRYNNLNNTAPEVDPLKQKKLTVPKSDFNLSCMAYFQGFDGLLMPFDWIKVLPNSSLDISYDVQAILKNPYVKKMLSGKRIYVHVYHANDDDLWEGARTFYKKGTDFKTNLQIPHMEFLLHDPQRNVFFNSRTTFAPSSYLGVPPEYYKVNGSQLDQLYPLQINDSNNVKISNSCELAKGSGVSALPFVMYQKIYQAHYLNKNLIYNNDKWLPSVEDNFRLPIEASGQSICQLSHDTAVAFSPDISSVEFNSFNERYFVPRHKPTPQSDGGSCFLNAPRFRQFKGDMFTAGSPFVELLRGDTPVMSFNDLVGSVDWSNVIATGQGGSSVGLNDAQETLAGGYITNGPNNDYIFVSTANANQILKNALDKAVVRVQNQVSFNLNALRALSVYTLMGERAARTDGTYNSYIKSFFGVNPNYRSHEPKYLGGFYIDMVNSEVTQTSETQNSPLGTVASKGIGTGSGRIGKFQFDDYGYIMAVMSVTNEVVYTQGLDRSLTELNWEDQYNPMMNGLAPQATKSVELFISNSKVDNDLPFNYVERFSHLKSRRNKALTANALPRTVDVNGSTVNIDLENTEYLQVRHFASRPTFNNVFDTMTPDNVDRSVYSAPNEAPFQFSVGCRVEGVLPLPYITQPASLGMTA